MNVTLQTGKLYILSGIQGSGKSTFLKRNNISKEMVLSSDKIRTKLIKKAFKKKGNLVKTRISDNVGELTFKILFDILELKLQEKLTVFVDATSISDEERHVYAKLANKHNVEMEVLIFDIPFEECLLNNKNRDTEIDEDILVNFNERFERTSKYPYQLVTSNTDITLVDKNILDSNLKLDVIGDIHGLYTLFLEKITSLGYIIENGIPVHPDDRRLLFLGDFIDRGTESIDMFYFIKKAVESGLHFSVAGNHEIKLLKNLSKDVNNILGSYATKRTYLDLIIDKRFKKDDVTKFIGSLPGYYIQDQFLFTHANIGYFENSSTPFTELIYGSYPKKEVNADEEYDFLYKNKKNNYILIRGHIPQTYKSEYVFSLEEKQISKGNLVLLPIDKMKEKMNEGKSNRVAFEECVVRTKSNFDFDKHLKENGLFYDIEKMESKKLVKMKRDGLLCMVKYQPDVFYKNKWDEGGYLLRKSRGLVIDIAGKIIQHPFDKIFNYKENGAGLDIPDTEVVQYVEKLNGFLGNITLNPFTKELLITTTGSFDSTFVNYIKELLSPRQIGLLKHFLSTNDVTLSFEVIHPNDPHIIENNAYGLHLIGVRNKGFNDKNWSESDVDTVANLICFPRPSWGLATFKEVKEMISSCKHEGYMIRKQNGNDYDLVLKYKSPFYLTTKFIGRLGEGKVKFMFKSPEKFKANLDEEFFPIVDMLISNLTLEQYLEMNNNDSVTYVRNLIENHQR